MTDQDFSLNLGQPGFEDPKLQQVARTVGVQAAWRALFSGANPDIALSRVHGDFAMADVDVRGHGLAVVDRFSTHSLCWRIQDGGLAIAARADDLADVKTEIDPQAIYDYLFFHNIPSPRTIYKDIYRLPAAHALRFDGHSVRVWRYWTPEFVSGRNASFRDCKAEFFDLVKGSVERKLDGSKPACFLSGGTDSSSIAGLIQSVTGRGADGYSIGFEAEGYDEMAYARLAARRFDVRHHEYYVTPQDIADSIHKVAAHYDQPFGNSSALPTYYCSRMAAADGVTRLLAGDGGDELFGGNARYAKQRVFGWYQKIPVSLRNSVLEPLLVSPFAGHVNLLRKGASYVEQARVPMPARLNMYNLLLRIGSVEVLSPNLLARINQNLPIQHQQDVWCQVQGATDLNTTLAFDWRYTLAESDLPKVVGMTGLAGLEAGFPLLDSHLLDFSLRLPNDFKLRGLKLRWFFKEALRGFLPDEIIAKSKHGFGLPFGVWMHKHQTLNRIARDALQNLEARGVTRSGFTSHLWNVLLPEHPGYYGEMVWILMMLELWLEAKKPAFKLT